jgi:hypothetical protein
MDASPGMEQAGLIGVMISLGHVEGDSSSSPSTAAPQFVDAASQFAQGHAALALQADIDDYKFIFKGGDNTANNTAFKALVLTERGIKQSRKIITGRLGRSSHRVSFTFIWAGAGKDGRQEPPIPTKPLDKAPLPAVHRRRGGTMPAAQEKPEKAKRPHRETPPGRR